MSRLIDADALLEQYNLKDATKYGNKDDEQRAHSFSTMMLYEITDMIEDAPTAYDVDKVVEQLKEKVELAYKRYMDCDPYSPCFSRYRSQYYEREMCFEIVKGGVRNA